MSAGEGSKETIDSISSRDVEECLRVLDEVWPADDDLAPGAPRQLGRFSIVSELGRGGFGVVFLAEDPLLQRRVALKVPRVEVFAQSQGWRRFLREARTASRLDHPNLVPLLETGTIGPVGYIVSAFVEGPTLEQCLQDARGGAPARFSARLVAALAGAIEHMHDRGILHRDLKPANILMQAPECGGDLLTRYPWDEDRAIGWVPRICDFGLAVLREIDGDETRTRLGAGSPSYMAPEQAEARHEDIGPATDIYGLGATLYQLLTGRPPFTGASELETLRRVVADEPARPRHLRTDVPRDLETICLKCLAKRPEQRYASAAALAHDLERFLEGRPILARPVPAWERAWKWTRRHPALAALATATSLAVGGVLSGLIWHESVLRGVNERLSGANLELRSVNEQLRVAVAEKDKAAALLARQVAGHQVYGAQQALAAKNLELAHRQVVAAEQGLGTVEARGFACSYLRRSIRERLQLLAGHSASVECLGIAPDGRTLASADNSGAVRLWDLDTGRSRQIGLHSIHPYQSFTFSPDSRTLASLEHNGGLIVLWDVRTGERRRQLAHTGAARVSLLFFTPDGRHLAASQDDRDRAATLFSWWDIPDDTAVLPQTGLDRPPRKELTTVDERLALLASVLDGGPASALSDLEQSWIRHPPRGISLTRDRRLAVIGLGDGTFVVRPFRIGWDFLLGRIQSWGTSIVLADPARWSGHGESPEQDRNRLERLARCLVPASRGEHRDSDLLILGRTNDCVAYSNDGRMLAIWREEEDQLKIIDLTTGREGKAFDQGKINNVKSMCFTADGGTLALGCLDHMVRLWRIQAKQQPAILPGHAPKEAWVLAFAPDGRTLASGGDDHQIRLWDTATGREKAALTGHHSLVTSLAFSPDCRTLASGSFDVSRPVILWDVERGIRLVEPVAPTRKILAVALSPDGRVLAAAGDDMMVRLWDLKNGRLIRTIGAHSDRIFSLAFSPHGRTLASGGVEHRIALTDISTGKSRTMEAPDGCFALAFSPDGSRLYSAHHGGSIAAWDVARREQVASLPGHNTDVRCLAVSPDGTSLASGGDDRTVRVWDTVTNQELLCLTDCKARVNAVAFSPDGNSLAAADHSGAITIWHAGRAPR